MKSDRTSPGAEMNRRSCISAMHSVSRTTALSSLLITLAVLSGCNRQADKTASRSGDLESVASCRIALAPTPTSDSQIAQLQEKVRTSGGEKGLEDLGWAFIDKARTSYDPGYYRLAESCAACLESRSPRDPSALLLRGHALDSLHRFSEAEAIARELVSRRGLYLDYELLGDALMEQGKVSEAVAAYQSLMDL